MKKIAQFLLFTLLCIGVKAQEDKKVIGIASFTGNYQQEVLNSVEEVVTSSFAKTKRFTIVGRSQMKAISSERELQKTEDFIDSKYIAQTKSLGAQYLVSGNISSITTSTDRYTDSRGSTSYEYNSVITVDLKILDVETGQVVASDVVTSKANKGLLDMKSFGKNLIGAGPSNESEAYAVALKGFEKEIDKFVSKNFPISFIIVEVQQSSGNTAKTILISGGSLYGVEKGDKMAILEVIEVEVGGKKMDRKKEIGEIKISKVEADNFSSADVKSGGSEIFSKFNGKSKLIVMTKN